MRVRQVETPWETTLLAEPVRAPVVHRPVAAAASFRHLRTGRGNILVAGATHIEMGEETSPDALVALYPDGNRQLIFLLAPDMRPIEARGDGMTAPAISAFRLQTETPGVTRLRHPLAPQRFLGVTAPGAGGPDGCVLFDSTGAGPLDRFEAMRMDVSTLPPCLVHVAAEICAAVARPFRAATLLERLRGALLRPELAEPLIRVLPREELSDLARRLLDNPDDLVLLGQAMPENPWFARVLPELAAWRARRRILQGGVLHAPASDEFAGDPLEGYGQPQAGLALTALARATVQPTRGACLLATVRNEGAYFLEWLAYHRSIGFEHAFVYTNDNFDGSGTLLEALAGHGLITLIHNQVGTHCGPQYKMHAHALTLLPHILDYRWAALIDADEFIGFDKRRFRDFTDVLAWHETQPIDALALCWLMFCAHGDEPWRDAATLQRFTRREPKPNVHVKTIFRPARFWNARVHYPHAALGMPFFYRTETGALHHSHGMADRDPAFAAAPSADIAWINHYWLRTAPEMLWKMARGHPDWKGPTAARHLDMARTLCGHFVRLAARTDLVEDRRILACAENVQVELQSLRALAGIADAEAATRRDFLQRLPRMAQAFIESPAQGSAEPQEFTPFRALLRQATKDLCPQVS
jgi:hypothetical protein